MRVVTVCTCFLVLVSVMGAAAGQDEGAAKPLPDYFPADTVVYMEFPNVPALIEGYKGTGLWALYNDDSVAGIREFIESASGQESAAEGEAEGEGIQTFRTFLDLVYSIRGGAAFALVPGEEGLEALFVVRLGEDTSAAEALLDMVYAGEASDGTPSSTEEVSGVQARVSGVDREYSAIVDGLIFVGNRRAFTGALDRRNSPSNAGALSSSVNYTKASSFLTRENPVYRVVVDFAALRREAAAAIPGPMRAVLENALEAMGVDDIETVSMEGVFKLSGIVDHVYISTNNADSALIDMLGRERLDESVLALVPRGALFFGAKASNQSLLYGKAMTLMTSMGSMAGVDFEGVIERLETGSGVDFEHEVIDSLDSTSLGYFRLNGTPGLMMFASGAGFESVNMVKVRDEETLKEAIKKLAVFVAAEPTALGPLVPFAGSCTIETTKLGDALIYSAVPKGFQFAAPSLTVTKGWLVHANSKEAVVAAIDRLIAPAGSVRDSSDFARARSALSKKASQLAYINLDGLVEVLYNALLPMLAERIDTANQEGKIPFNAGDLPPAFRVKKHIDGISSAVSTAGNLIDMQIYSPTGMGAAILAPMLAVAAGESAAAFVVPPGVPVESTDAPKRKQLLEIGGMLQLSTTANHGRFPDKLTDVIPPEKLQAPQDPEPSSAVDYKYIRGFTAWSPGKTILVYERDGLQADGRHVLYVDGSVKFLTEKQFKEAMADQEALSLSAQEEDETPPAAEEDRK